MPQSAQELDYNLGAMVFTSCLSDTSIAASVETESAYSAYLYGVAPWAPTPKIRGSYTNWTAQEFSDRYISIYNEEPSYHAASSFAAAVCLVAAIESSQSMDTTVLKETLEKSFYNTFYANISFDPYHQAEFDMLISQILPSVSADNVTTWALEIVSPENIAAKDAQYPAPTWAKRSCDVETNNCDGHGSCDNSGTCQCDSGYYGAIDPLSCDTFCFGDLVNDVCKEIQVLYIGGMVAFQYAEADEYSASMRLAVDMINNKTDGWYDQSVPQVSFCSNCLQ